MSLPVHQSLSMQFDTSEEEFLASLGLLDMCEEKMAHLPAAEIETIHEFLTSGFYVRTFIVPAGSLVTSKIHRTEHPFTMHYGEMIVWTQRLGTMHLKGRHHGITPAMTKRIAYMVQDTKWTTFHQGDWKTVEEVEADIIVPHVNPLLSIPYRDAYNRVPTPKLESSNHDYVLHND